MQSPPQRHSFGFILLLRRRDQIPLRQPPYLRILGQRALENRRRHPAAHFPLPARTRQQRRPAPQAVGRRRVRVALGRVEEEVRNFRARNVQVFRGDVGEDDARGHLRAGPEAGGVEEVFLAEVGET